MRLNRTVIVLFFVVLASSAFAEDNRTLFTPDYSEALKASEEKGVVWEPTVKSAQKINFNKVALRPEKRAVTNREAFRASVVSQTSALEQTVATPSVAFDFVVGFNAHRAELTRQDFYDSSTQFFRVEGSEFVSNLSVVGSSVAGEIWLPGSPGKVEHRSIRTRGGDSYLVEWDQEENNRLMARCPVGVHEFELETLSVVARMPVRRAIAPPREPEVVGPCDAGMTLTDIVDYLVLFDKTGYDYFLSDEEREAYAKNVVASMNATIINSQGVGWVKLAGRTTIGLVSSGDIGDDLFKLAASEEAATLREEYKADIVGLFVGSPNPNYGGMSYEFGGGPNYGFMVAHVAVAATVPAHEFGHTLGMGHQPEYCPNPYLPFARGHLVDGWFGDTMSALFPGVCPGGCDIVPAYSNPNVLAYGRPTGVPGERENWRMIGIAFPVVSKYREGSKATCMPSLVRAFGVVK